MTRFKKKKQKKEALQAWDVRMLEQTREANKSLNSPSRALGARGRRNNFLIKLPGRANLIPRFAPFDSSGTAFHIHIKDRAGQ